MNLISASLGVTCGSCHVRNGNQWEFEKDDKKNKQVARKMMQMTLDINKTSFEGKTEVTCYSCHQGHGHPITVPSLPIASNRPGSNRGAAQVTSQQVLAKYVEPR